MKETNEKVYRCDHCNKAMVSKGLMVYHEKWCKKNPNNMHKCFEWCQYLVRESVTEPNEHGCNIPVQYNFHCELKPNSLFSYKLEKKYQKHPLKLAERTNGLERMPLSCELFKGQDEVDDYNFDDD